jgi:hypothetical protein
MEKMILLLRPDQKQQDVLNDLSAAQQNPTSPYYHQWLTSESYSSHFGVSDGDLRQVMAWLAGHGLQVDEITTGRWSILFSGSVEQVEEAFHTRIHSYSSMNELHYANATDPEIPFALSAIVEGVVSLHDFQLNPLHARLTALSLRPGSDNTRYVTPPDVAAIYNLAPLYASGITGAGESIAVAGRTHIQLSDVRRFRATYGLPANDPEILVLGPDPGRLGLEEEAEAVLDLDRSGAVAPRASIKLIVSGSTSATDGIFLAAQYIVDHNLAPILSVNFGLCEAALGSSANSFLHRLWQQAAVQGISVVVPSGNGDDGCGDPSAITTSGRTGVNGLSSTPYNIAVGDANSNPVKRPGTHGGEASTIYSSPWWQYGERVPSDDHRYVPDVTLASGNQDTFPIYLDGLTEVTGGGSMAGASFSGIMALVAQSTGDRQGNAAPVLYSLANRQRNNGGSQAFHNPGAIGDNPYTDFNSVSGLGSVDAYLLVTRWGSSGDGTWESRRINSASSLKAMERTIVDMRSAVLACLINCREFVRIDANGDTGMALNMNRGLGLAKRSALPLAALLLSLSLNSQSQTAVPEPVLFYSDIDSGPERGGEGGTDGAFVCVYGENFGASRGSSALTVGGMPMASYKVWHDPGAPYRPGYYAKACGQVSHLTRSGAADLQLTTSHGASNALTFTIRPGKIYFVASQGNDKTGNGSSSQPWLTIKHCKSAMNSGDICYLRGGIHNSIESYGAVLLLNSSGAAGSPKAIVAYPGETVSIDNHTTGSGGAAILSYLSSGTYRGGQRISYWTLAGLSINGSGMSVDLPPGNYIRMVDNDIQCEGPYCYGSDAGLLIGNPAASSFNFAVFGNRIRDVGCHEDADYTASAHPCAWFRSGNTRMTTSGTSWSTSEATSSFFAGEIVQANGQPRKLVSCTTPACRSGKLDVAFTPDITASAFQFRLPYPTKLFHSVYFGNVNAVQFAWNDVDGSAGKACRGVQFHSTNGNNEYDLHVFSNAIHDTVCDCLNFATVDPSRGTVEAYNNILYNCGTALPTVTAASYSAIYSSNTNDDYAETMTRKGNIQVYNNTVYNAGSGGLYNKACFAVQVSGDITAVFPHAQLAADLLPGSEVTALVTGLCGYGTACTTGHIPVPFRAGQVAVLDAGTKMEEVQIASVPDAMHVILTSVGQSHASGVKLTGANGNVGIVATNNVCVQPGVTNTSYASLLGTDAIKRPAASYFLGTNNDCYGIRGTCPLQLIDSLNAEPSFVDPTQHNFRLRASTRLKGAGASNRTSSTDQDGYSRTLKPTIGAFEATLTSGRQE